MGSSCKFPANRPSLPPSLLLLLFLLLQVSVLSSQLYELQVVSEKRLAAAAAEGQAALRAERLELQVGQRNTTIGMSSCPHVPAVMAQPVVARVQIKTAVVAWQ